MLSFTPLSPRAIAIVAEGHFTAADIGEDVELWRGVEDRGHAVERRADVGGGEMAFRDDGDGAGG
jgi:hypothetical protein